MNHQLDNERIKMKRDLLKKIVSDLVKAIGTCRGLEVYAKGNNSFEQAMQIVACDTLKLAGVEAVEVEKRYKSFSESFRFSDKTKDPAMDIYFESDQEKCAMELKIIIKGQGGGKSDLAKITEDIEKLKGLKNFDVANRTILFAVFPCESKNEFVKWVQDGTDVRKRHYKVIENLELATRDFSFSDKTTKGLLFFGNLK